MGAALATGCAMVLGGAINFGAIWRYNGSFILMGEYWRPFFAGVLILAPAMAAGLWLDLGFIARSALLAGSLAPFALHARRYWNRFNAA